MTAPSPKKVGILALQGCVEPHVPHIEACGAQVKLVRKASDLKDLDALILPGGESTTMLKLLNTLDMKEALREAFSRIPCWGICAGAILMAQEVSHPAQECFAALDISIERNAYGRQAESFNTQIDGSDVSFIRAPKITRVGPGLKILAQFDGGAVWVASDRHVASTFHPELSLEYPSKMHTFFINRA